MNLKMTLEEIQTKYPNRWLGLSNVLEDDEGHIQSAEVVYDDKTASELGLMSLCGENIRPYFTTPDNTFYFGMIM